jgi:hypothetical protein
LRPLAAVQTEDHGGLLLHRLWHPSAHTTAAATFRPVGLFFRFDPHLPRDDAAARQVWYGGEAFETAVRERFDRDRANATPRVAVCSQNRMATVRLAAPTRLVDLTVAAHALGADDDLGDRRDVDYADTQAWARAIFEDPAPDGVRYFSARHRDVDRARVGVNVALWGGGRPTVVADEAMAHPGVWRRLLTILDRVGVGVERRTWCSRCTM